MILQRLKEKIRHYKEELDLFIDEAILQKKQEYSIPTVEEFQVLRSRIEELEQEAEKVRKRRVQEENERAPDVPEITFEHATCKICERPQYRLGYCLYHFERQYLDLGE